jgi:hypothetical protein
MFKTVFKKNKTKMKDQFNRKNKHNKLLTNKIGKYKNLKHKNQIMI